MCMSKWKIAVSIQTCSINTEHVHSFQVSRHSNSTSAGGRNSRLIKICIKNFTRGYIFWTAPMQKHDCNLSTWSTFAQVWRELNCPSCKPPVTPLSEQQLLFHPMNRFFKAAQIFRGQVLDTKEGTKLLPQSSLMFTYQSNKKSLS